jgi:hypothetical protein
MDQEEVVTEQKIQSLERLCITLAAEAVVVPMAGIPKVAKAAADKAAEMEMQDRRDRQTPEAVGAEEELRADKAALE